MHTSQNCQSWTFGFGSAASSTTHRAVYDVSPTKPSLDIMVRVPVIIRSSPLSLQTYIL